MCKYFLPLLQAANADFERTIINVTSQAGWLTKAPAAGAGMIGYCASKAAENALTAGLHRIYATDDPAALEIRGGDDPTLKVARIIALHPGVVQTGLGYVLRSLLGP